MGWGRRSYLTDTHGEDTMTKTTALLAFVALAGACDDADTLTRAESIASLTERVVALEADRADLGVIFDFVCDGENEPMLVVFSERKDPEFYAGLALLHVDSEGGLHMPVLHVGREGGYTQCYNRSDYGYFTERIVVTRIAPIVH
jgi:hypothetical protein